MEGILADADVEGQLEVLVGIIHSTMWREFWEHLRIRVYSFEELGLTSNAADVFVWRACQRRQIVLVTDNRNKHGDDSLEATLLRENHPNHLPVFTLSNARRIRIMKDKAFAAATAEKMIQYLLDIERLRGTGRLYLP